MYNIHSQWVPWALFNFTQKKKTRHWIFMPIAAFILCWYYIMKVPERTVIPTIFMFIGNIELYYLFLVIINNSLLWILNI